MFRIISNIAELVGLIKATPNALDNAISTRMRRATLLVEGTAKQNSPVRTGTLRRSITSSVVQSGHLTTGVVGTPVIYGPFVHDGTRFIKANPFIRKAIDADSDQIRDIIGSGMEDIGAHG